MQKLLFLILLFISSGLNAQSLKSQKNDTQAVSADSLQQRHLRKENSIYPIRMTSYHKTELPATEVEEVRTDDNNNSAPVTEPVRTVAYYDEMIAAVQTKIDWVRNNPEEHKKAIESGWYEQMDSYISKYKQEKEELIKREEQK